MQGEGKGLERETNLEDSPFAIRRKKVVVESNFGEKESFLPLLHVCVWRISA